MNYKIFNTSNETIYKVITLAKHAFDILPTAHPLKQDDVILICDEDREINFIMFYDEYYEDTNNESKDFFPKGATHIKKWQYIIRCNNVKKLSEPLRLCKFPNPNNKSYGKTQTFSYVEDPQDVDFVTNHLLRYL